MGKSATKASRAKSVEAYISAQPETSRAVLEKVRAAIRRALPEAEETISYAIPAYRVDGRVVIYFAGWKEHFALYPAREALVTLFAKELAGRVVSKGTIRFSLAEPVPVRLIQRIAKFNAKTLAARAG